MGETGTEASKEASVLGEESTISSALPCVHTLVNVQELKNKQDAIKRDFINTKS